MIKKNRFASRMVMLLLAAVLIFAAGCQAIGGLDFNKALIQSMKVTSSESTGSISFKLKLDEEALAEIDEEEAALYRLLSDIRLSMDEVKMQDSNHISMKGNLSFGEKYSIGYAIQQSAQTMVVTLEGAKSPFVLDLTSEALLGDNGEPLSGEQTQTLTDIGFKMNDIAGGYLIGNLPNPESLKVAPANESINGENVALLHASFQMDGKQLWAWVSSYIDGLVKDRAGLDAMVKGIIEVLSEDPVLWEAIGEINPFESGILDAPTTDEIAEQTAEEIANVLIDLQKELKSLQEEDQESFDELFNDSLVLKADLYVDSKLDIRKSLFELNYDIPSSLWETGFYGDYNAEDEYAEYDVSEEYEEEISENDSFDEFEDYEEYEEYEDGMPALPFTGFTVKVESEQWNVNGAVQVDAPVVTDDVLDIEELTWLSGYETIGLFEPGSDLYALLRDELHLTRQTYYAYSDSYYNPPIIVPGYITIVAVRDVAETFGASVEFDGKTNTIEVFDEATDTTLVFTIGSDKVLVNGHEQLWPFPVTKISGSTYVPARKLAETLGADIGWETLFGDWKQLTIEREL